MLLSGTNLEQKERRIFRFLRFKVPRNRFLLKMNSLERIYGIPCVKKLNFLPLYWKKEKPWDQIARGFESIIDNNRINLCSSFFFFFLYKIYIYIGERERLKSLNRFNFKLFIAFYIYFSNRSFYILLNVLIFCKYNLISFCRLKKFRSLFRNFILESSYVFGYVQILNNYMFYTIN